MNVLDLARSYLKKAEARLAILPILKEKKAYSDVVREAQETVELATKGMLRAVGIDPPKFHDVSDLLEEYQDRFPEEVRKNVGKLCRLSKILRKERELSFYGDIDFIPTEEYDENDAQEAIEQAEFTLKMAALVIA